MKRKPLLRNLVRLQGRSRNSVQGRSQPEGISQWRFVMGVLFAGVQGAGSSGSTPGRFTCVNINFSSSCSFLRWHCCFCSQEENSYPSSNGSCDCVRTSATQDLPKRVRTSLRQRVCARRPFLCACVAVDRRVFVTQIGFTAYRHRIQTDGFFFMQVFL